MMTRIEMDYMNAVISLNRKTPDGTKPDWEQRRYEIVKEIAIRHLTSPNEAVRIDMAFNSGTYIEGAIDFANELIDKLIEENLKHPLK